MVDRSDLVVFCIQRGSGGAWQTMKYAKKQGKNDINLNDQMEKAESYVHAYCHPDIAYADVQLSGVWNRL